jgi:hypothetical protein
MIDFLTRPPKKFISSRVITHKSDRPYFDSWLRRTRRQFQVSGRLTQTATRLATEEGGTVDEWRTRLHDILDERTPLSLDLLTRIDALLAGPAKFSESVHSQELLWHNSEKSG